jgi:hypothetical protein
VRGGQMTIKDAEIVDSKARKTVAIVPLFHNQLLLQ